MADKDSRTFGRTSYYFINSADVPGEKMVKVEGKKLEGNTPIAKVIMVTDRFSCCEYTKFKGTRDPTHVHADHETFNFLIKGKMRLTIDGQEFVAGPGSYWLHPAGVPHANEMIEDCVQLEVKIPPTKTW